MPEESQNFAIGKIEGRLDGIEREIHIIRENTAKIFQVFDRELPLIAQTKGAHEVRFESLERWKRNLWPKGLAVVAIASATVSWLITLFSRTPKP